MRRTTEPVPVHDGGEQVSNFICTYYVDALTVKIFFRAGKSRRCGNMIDKSYHIAASSYLTRSD